MRVLADQGQMRIAVACLHLDPHITPSAVQRLVPAHVASANRVAAALVLMHRQGDLIAGPYEDRRVRRYSLSDDARELFEEFLAMMVGAGSPFAERPFDWARSHVWREDFLLATIEPGAGLKSGMKAERSQTLRGGALLNLELLRRGLVPSCGEPFTRKGFGRRFGLSRAQVIALVDLLREGGWVRLENGDLQPTALAMEAGRVWLSRFLAISTAVLDERFRAIVAASRAQVAAARGSVAHAVSVTGQRSAKSGRGVPGDGQPDQRRQSR